MVEWIQFHEQLQAETISHAVPSPWLIAIVAWPWRCANAVKQFCYGHSPLRALQHTMSTKEKESLCYDTRRYAFVHTERFGWWLRTLAHGLAPVLGLCCAERWWTCPMLRQSSTRFFRYFSISVSLIIYSTIYFSCVGEVFRHTRTVLRVS